MSAEPSCDVVVIGAGHNGLVCAGYLARDHRDPKPGAREILRDFKRRRRAG